jgi:hypothetical protein
MKHLIIAFFSLLILLSCSESSVRNKNPYLPDYAFSLLINTNLPLYSGLNSPVFPIIVTDNGSGVSIIVMKVSATDYRAWDANCPNQYPTSCSKMSINGINAKCSCDNIEYSIFTGIGTGNYTMKPYRVEVSGANSIRIYN